MIVLLAVPSAPTSREDHICSAPPACSKSVTKALIAGVQDSKGEMSFTHREEHEPMQETDEDQCKIHLEIIDL